MLTRILENNVRLGFDIPETKFGEMIRLHEYDETQSINRRSKSKVISHCKVRLHLIRQAYCENYLYSKNER